jgi:hypothetical protein
MEPLDGQEPVSGSREGPEIVWTSARLGTAAALDCGIRRARGEVVVLLDTSLEPTGDFVSPLVAVLEDASMAVAGGWGIVSDDLRTFREAPPGDVDAIEGYCLAFRRADSPGCGPLDERFRFYRNLTSVSPVLRDEGRHDPGRAVRIRRCRSSVMSIAACQPPAATRPAEQAQLLPDHRPLRIATRPAGREPGPLVQDLAETRDRAPNVESAAAASADGTAVAEAAPGEGERRAVPKRVPTPMTATRAKMAATYSRMLRELVAGGASPGRVNELARVGTRGGMVSPIHAPASRPPMWAKLSIPTPPPARPKPRRGR